MQVDFNRVAIPVGADDVEFVAYGGDKPSADLACLDQPTIVLDVDCDGGTGTEVVHLEFVSGYNGRTVSVSIPMKSARTLGAALSMLAAMPEFLAC
jgi:hypothetical protein